MARLILACIALTSTLALAAQSQAQERSWSLDTSNTEAFLTFGVAESDDVGISLWCKMKSGKIHIFLPDADAALKPNRKTRIGLSVSDKTFKFRAKTLANEEASTTSVEAVVNSSDPFFAVLLDADKFTISAGKQDQNFPLDGADISALRRICAKG